MVAGRGRLVSLSNRKLIVKLIDEARASGARLEPACKVTDISLRTYQRWTKNGEIKGDQRPLVKRPVPANKLSENEKDMIIEVVNAPEYRDLPPTQIVPRLADEGIYIASESTFYRTLHEAKMVVHRGKTRPPVSRPIATHIATKPNQVWTWDITWLNRSVRGLYYKLYMILDLFSRKVVGYEVWETENAEYSERLVKRTLLSEGIAGQPLVLHSDNGGPMKASTFLATLEKLGVQSSFSRPRVSNDNPYSEALFKTLKYVPHYPDEGFETLADARQWVSKFVHWYNHIHCHSGLKFITPYQRHHGLDAAIMEHRKKVYMQAKAVNPSRWSGKIRDWDLPGYVALNPVKESEILTSLPEMG